VVVAFIRLSVPVTNIILISLAGIGMVELCRQLQPEPRLYAGVLGLLYCGVSLCMDMFDSEERDHLTENKGLKWDHCQRDRLFM
jgi:hypothetical protein